MENPVAEAGEVANAVTDALENFGFVVAAFGEAVGIRHIKGIEDVLAPVKRRCG